MDMEDADIMKLRRAIVSEARSWIGTRFHHQGRVKKTDSHKGGCDCIGLIIGVAAHAGIHVEQEGAQIAAYDLSRTDYGKRPDGIMLQQALASYLQPVAAGDIKEGDILLFRFEENPQHVAFVSDYSAGGEEKQRGIIHCYAQVRKVVEHHLSDEWNRRIVAAYRFKALQK